jgi:tetratricopeptide (TPR) repeat protein
MAYARRRGNQVAIVHGVRNPESDKVDQQILFTFYSKTEALDALGRRKNGNSDQFRFLLEKEYPEISFNWKKINKGISDNLDVLPDIYEYKSTRLRSRFRTDLCVFAKQLILADPQELLSSAQLIKDHRFELKYISDLIQWRLKLCDQEESKWNKDNPFYWRFALQGREVPPDTEEEAAGYYKRGDYERAEAIFRLLTECFDNYAEGYNYLGLIASEQRKLDVAIEYFEKTIEVGRRLFPKEIPKKRYWKDLSTRPYMRGLQNLAMTLNQTGNYIEALNICERLENECGDDITAASCRASIYLNIEEWQLAANAASKLHKIFPSESFTAAFAFLELGDAREANAFFLHAALNHPRAAQRLVGKKTKTPETSDEVKDRNVAVELQRSINEYLQTRGKISLRHFKTLLDNPHVSSLLREVIEVVERRKNQHQTNNREAFDRMQLMHTPEFARLESNGFINAPF